VSLTPRLRMFAGPNGSGKSTLKSLLRPNWLGFYINPDEMEHEIRTTGFFNIAPFGISTTLDELRSFFQSSMLLKKAGLLQSARSIGLSSGRLTFAGVKMNSYFASVVADFLRRKFLQQKISFTFETVMSSPDKVELLKTAQDQGYRTYLYYIATNDPQLNILRIKNRVKHGGHPVPSAKVISRYKRSLGLLLDAIRNTNRAYVFDNSGIQRELLAEFTDGQELRLETREMPLWFKKFVLDKIQPAH
jgi:predicted ABC-type ATPase